MQETLIYDVGMHNGDDTAYYLACGYRVVAVDADPDSVAAAEKRFQAEIAAKRLTILNVGIADQETSGEFWIDEVRSDLNSFDRENILHHGHPHHSVTVSCRRLENILKECGVPFYLKIDIEGHDIVCCKQLTPGDLPPYISVEMRTEELLLTLRDLGYTRFMLVRQADFNPVVVRDANLHERILRAIYRLANYRVEDRRLHMRAMRAGAATIVNLARSLGTGRVSRPVKSTMAPDWKFRAGSSGPFGKDLAGEWCDWEELAYVWFRELRESKKDGGVFWCDLHAKVSATLQ